MTRLFTDGAEAGDQKFWTYVYQGGVSTDERSGTYSYYFGYSGQYGYKNLPYNVSEFYFRTGFKVNSTNTFLRFYDVAGAAGNTVFYLSLPAGFLSYSIGGITTTSGSNACSLSVWNLLEIHLKIHDTLGVFEAKLNGIDDAYYTGNTKAYAAGTVACFYVRTPGAAGATTYVDDMAFNDANGTDDNSWCGDGHIIKISPDGEGDTLQWTPSTGTTHYTLVDEIPPSGGTDYVTTNIPGYRDMYHMSAYSSTGKSIRRIWSEVRAKDNQAVGAAINLGIKTSSGSVILSSASAILTSNYDSIKGEEFLVNPEDGQPWEGTDIDNIQFVVEAE